jgi:hypothetical protein
MARWLRVALGTLIVLAVIAAPVGLALHQQAQMRNFRVVRPGVLYRSGQMTLKGLERVVNDYHIRTRHQPARGERAIERPERAGKRQPPAGGAGGYRGSVAVGGSGVLGLVATAALHGPMSSLLVEA